MNKILTNLFIKWTVVSQFVELMNHSAMALGNHEFDDGIESNSTGNIEVIGLAPFVDKMWQKLPILSCNLDISREPLLQGKVFNSIVKEIAGKKIAIIGYTIPDTVYLASPGDTVEFKEEIVSIRKEIDVLKKNHPDINIFIALGHSGFAKDIEIAKSIPQLDVVVGGHTNTFLYTGKPPSNDVPEREYPVEIKHDDGNMTLVVQAYAYGKYLGKLDLQFDESGKIEKYSGSPILLDESQEEGKTEFS